MPRIMLIKETIISFLVGTPLEGLAKRIRWLISIPNRRRHPELIDVYCEGDRVDQIIRRVVHESSNCIDVGCHVGSVLSLIVRLAPGGRHMALEPVPWKAARLARKFPGVDVKQMALGETTGEVTFQINTESSGYSGFRTSDSSTHIREVTVPCERLDQLVPPERKIDFLKIDVEGAELMVLRGARKLIERDRPTIVFESARSALNLYSLKPSDMYCHLVEENGYELFTPRGLLENDQPLSVEQYDRAHDYPFKAFNFVAIPRSRAWPSA
jgi:FkbM family methyltransferase